MSVNATVHIKRIYEQAAPTDGFRVLVDRLWPRGESKENAHVDLWLKAVAPTSELRKWFNHEPEKYPEFQARYIAELDHNDAMTELRALCAEHPVVTLVYGAKDTEHNQAVVLLGYLTGAARP